MTAPIVAVSAFVAFGCGGASKGAYIQSLDQAQVTLQQSVSSIGPVIGSGAGGDQVVSTLDAGGKAMEAAADDFARITPPSDAKHAHVQVLGGLRKLAGNFRDAAGAARSGDDAKLVKLLEGIQESAGAREVKAAQKELNAKGYTADAAY